MSRSDLLFEPRSLARVVNHVEWEQEVRYYKDGRSNQEMYVQAMSMLLERWLREFSLPDLLGALDAAGGGDWPGLVHHGLQSIESKVQQFRGFWEGLWYGANPRGAGFGSTSYRSELERLLKGGRALMPDDLADMRMLAILTSFFSTLRELADDSFTRPNPTPKGGA